MRRRLIVLGASNVARGWPGLLHLAGAVAQPIEALVAMGHGRSYGRASRFLWRTRSGILECDLWQHFARRRHGPTTAIITDVGNDLFYDVTVDELSGWVATILERLSQQSAHLVLTLPPAVNLPRLSAARYTLFRRLFFPQSRLNYAAAIERATQLAEALEQFGQTFGATIVVPERDWYGLDPIHPTRSGLLAQWRTALERSGWPLPPAALPASHGGSTRLRPWRARAGQEWVLGRKRRAPQPQLRLASGSRISFF